MAASKIIICDGNFWNKKFQEMSTKIVLKISETNQVIAHMEEAIFRSVSIIMVTADTMYQKNRRYIEKVDMYFTDTIYRYRYYDISILRYP